MLALNKIFRVAKTCSKATALSQGKFSFIYNPLQSCHIPRYYFSQPKKLNEDIYHFNLEQELLANDLSNTHRKADPVFVSKHFQISNEEIIHVLNSHNIEHKVRPSGEVCIKYCMFCRKPHNNDPTNLWVLNLKPNSGAFFCFRCGTRGSWFDFKKNLMGTGVEAGLYPVNKSVTFNEENDLAALNFSQPKKLASEAEAFFKFQSMLKDKFPEINNYLTGKGPEDRHLSKEVLIKYRVGVGEEYFASEKTGGPTKIPCVYFPMFAPKSKKQKEKGNPVHKVKNPNGASSFSTVGREAVENPEPKTQSQDPEPEAITSVSSEDYQLVRNKIRGVGKENKRYQRMEPSPGYWGLFGLNTVPEHSKVIVLTEGEYDAMAVHQATGLPAVSLPNGANHLPLQILPWLERFDKIYLWMDADEVGKANAQQFAQKLGANRTYIVDTHRFDPDGPKDANDALRNDPTSLTQFIKDARPITRENLTTFSELRHVVLNRILKHEENMGVKSEFFSWFNRKMKGFRRGEFTIVTGATGSGKTTFLAQHSLDFCRKGIGTLWGSFEVRNDILMTQMLMQHAGVNLIEHSEKFEYFADSFEQLPLYFMKFFGSHDIAKIITTIEYAIYAYDIGHVIIDNLQFMLSGQGKGFERFDIQDDAISKLRHLATTKNIHITLVIHPKKVDDGTDLSIASVFGTAKATQEADNIFIIQTRPKFRIIDIKKNRYDGETGRIALGFEKDTKRFFELTEDEVVQLHRTSTTLAQIVKARKENMQPEEEVELGQEISKLKKKDSSVLGTEKVLERLETESKSQEIRKEIVQMSIEKSDDDPARVDSDDTYLNTNRPLELLLSEESSDSSSTPADVAAEKSDKLYNEKFGKLLLAMEVDKKTNPEISTKNDPASDIEREVLAEQLMKGLQEPEADIPEIYKELQSDLRDDIRKEDRKIYGLTSTSSDDEKTSGKEEKKAKESKPTPSSHENPDSLYSINDPIWETESNKVTKFTDDSDETREGKQRAYQALHEEERRRFDPSEQRFKKKPATRTSVQQATQEILEEEFKSKQQKKFKKSNSLNNRGFDFEPNTNNRNNK